MKLKVLILNDRDRNSGFGGQASFIKNLHPFLEKEYNLTYLTLPGVYHQQKIIPIRLLYLFRVISFLVRKRKTFDLIISHTPEASFAASLFTVPFIHIFHGNANPLSMSKFRTGKYFKWVFDRFETRVAKKAGLLYTVGEPGKKAMKIYNPIEYIPEKILSYDERRDFIFSGRLENVKNVDVIIKRYNTLPAYIKQNNKLHLIGTGTRENNLKTLVNELNLTEKVIFHGLVPNEKSISLTSRSYILLMASSHEGFPMTIAESLTVGTPVISTNVGDIRSVLKDGINGYLLPANFTSEEFNERITSILSDYERFSENAVKSSCIFRADEIAGQLIAGCNEVILQ